MYHFRLYNIYFQKTSNIDVVYSYFVSPSHCCIALYDHLIIEAKSLFAAGSFLTSYLMNCHNTFCKTSEDVICILG